MENLQIEAGYVFKLVGICCGGVAYYLSQKNSFSIVNERQKTTRKLVDDHIHENKEEHKRMYDKIECKADKK